jgi:hypothetical protein
MSCKLLGSLETPSVVGLLKFGTVMSLLHAVAASPAAATTL